MREIRHRVQSCQTLLVFFRWCRGALVPCQTPSANVIANVGADRPTEEIALGAAQSPQRSSSPSSSRRRRPSKWAPSSAGTISTDRGAALAAMMGVSGE